MLAAGFDTLATPVPWLGGKTLRLNPDGTTPSDNPFPGSPVYSLGHHNSQGLDWDPKSGLQFQTEHGPSGFDGPGGGDEVNIVESGGNYGWPCWEGPINTPGYSADSRCTDPQTGVYSQPTVALLTVVPLWYLNPRIAMPAGGDMGAGVSHCVSSMVMPIATGST